MRARAPRSFQYSLLPLRVMTQLAPKLNYKMKMASRLEEKRRELSYQLTDAVNRNDAVRISELNDKLDELEQKTPEPTAPQVDAITQKPSENGIISDPLQMDVRIIAKSCKIIAFCVVFMSITSVIGGVIAAAETAFWSEAAFGYASQASQARITTYIVCAIIVAIIAAVANYIVNENSKQS